jgi:translation initiation factor 1 (eIF-1/SUI1)
MKQEQTKPKKRWHFDHSTLDLTICGAVMNQDVAHITITSVQDARSRKILTVAIENIPPTDIDMKNIRITTFQKLKSQ